MQKSFGQNLQTLEPDQKIPIGIVYTRTPNQLYDEIMQYVLWQKKIIADPADDTSDTCGVVEICVMLKCTFPTVL